MAVEAIRNPKMTYQGSASGTDISSASMDKTVNSEVSEPAVEESVQEKSYSQESANRSGEEQITAANIGKEAMKKAVEEINRNAKNSEAVFGIHDATNRITIKIVDKDTKKVLKEYPPEKTLDMIAKVWEMAGLMVDEKR